MKTERWKEKKQRKEAMYLPTNAYEWEGNLYWTKQKMSNKGNREERVIFVRKVYWWQFDISLH